MSRLIDLTGKRFGRWTVIVRAGYEKKKPTWLVRCDCENKTVKVVRGHCLREGKTHSCGCWRKELAINRYGIKDDFSNLSRPQDRWRLRHRDQYRRIQREFKKKWLASLSVDQKKRMKNQKSKSAKRSAVCLSDYYVKNRLRMNGHVPDKLIAAKREVLLTKRLLKGNDHGR